MNWKSQIQWWVGTHKRPSRPNRFLTGLTMPTLPHPRPSNDSPHGTYHHHFTPAGPPDKQEPLPHFSNTLTMLTASGAVSGVLLPLPTSRPFPKHQASITSPQKREQSSDTCFQGTLSQWTYGLYLSETIDFNECFSPAHIIVETILGAIVAWDINVNSWQSFASSM